MIQEYSRQKRKFACNILAVVQQYDIIKEPRSWCDDRELKDVRPVEFARVFRGSSPLFGK